MQFQPKKKWIITACIIFLFVITNPTIQSFKAFLGDSDYDGLRRKMNFMIFSIYEDFRHDSYIGILGNFIPLPKPSEKVVVNEDANRNYNFHDVADSEIIRENLEKSGVIKHDFNKIFDESVGKKKRNLPKDTFDFNRVFDEVIKGKK
jgi:hypothetical protein